MRTFFIWVMGIVAVLFGLLVATVIFAPPTETDGSSDTKNITSENPPLAPDPDSELFVPLKEEARQLESSTSAQDREEDEVNLAASSFADDLPTDFLSKRIAFSSESGDQLMTLREYLALIAKNPDTQTTKDAAGSLVIVRHRTYDALTQTTSATDIQFRVAEVGDSLIMERMLVDGEELTPEQMVMVFFLLVSSLKDA